MQAQYPSRREDDIQPVARGEEVVGFALLAFAVICFVAWPKKAHRFERLRRAGHREPEGLDHPYRKAARKPPRERTWIYRVPRRDDELH